MEHMLAIFAQRQPEPLVFLVTIYAWLFLSPRRIESSLQRLKCPVLEYDIHKVLFFRNKMHAKACCQIGYHIREPQL